MCIASRWWLIYASFGFSWVCLIFLNTPVCKLFVFLFIADNIHKILLIMVMILIWNSYGDFGSSYFFSPHFAAGAGSKRVVRRKVLFLMYRKKK